MSIRKYRTEFPGFYPWNVLDSIEDFFNPSTTYEFQYFNPQTHDLVPKESYKKELAESKKQERERLLKRAEELQKEIDELKT